MSAATIEVGLFEEASPAARGEAHGERWRPAIHELAAIRAELTIAKSAMRTREEVLAVARLHLPVLAAYDADLHAELVGIARGAALTPEEIVVLNHYTDLRDVPRSVIDGAGAGEGGEPEEGGCTAVYIPGVAAPVLGQTWDMHGTAEPYVRLLHLRPRGGDEEYLCFTLAGCLGMTGLSARGVGVTINNLPSTDAQIGVVWPALVRALLREPSAAAARDRLMATPLSSGHHYMIADGHDFYGVETSGRLKVVTQQGGRAAHLHTNHCFDPVLRKVEKVARTSTTFRRMEIASTLYVQQRPRDADELWDFLSSHEGYPRSICSHVDDAGGDPSASRTCGRMVLDLGRGRVLASPGCGQANPSRTYTLDRWRPPAPQASV